jgi:hypothetical protein
VAKQVETWFHEVMGPVQQTERLERLHGIVKHLHAQMNLLAPLDPHVDLECEHQISEQNSDYSDAALAGFHAPMNGRAPQNSPDSLDFHAPQNSLDSLDFHERVDAPDPPHFEASGPEVHSNFVSWHNLAQQ